MEPAVLELVDGTEREAPERVQLPNPRQVEEAVSLERAEDRPERDPEADPRDDHAQPDEERLAVDLRGRAKQRERKGDDRDREIEDEREPEGSVDEEHHGRGHGQPGQAPDDRARRRSGSRARVRRGEPGIAGARVAAASRR